MKYSTLEEAQAEIDRLTAQIEVNTARYWNELQAEREERKALERKMARYSQFFSRVYNETRIMTGEITRDDIDRIPDFVEQ